MSNIWAVISWDETPIIFQQLVYMHTWHYSAARDWLSIVNAVSIRFRRVVTNRNFVEMSNVHVNCQLEAQPSPSWNEAYGPATGRPRVALFGWRLRSALILLCVSTHSKIKSPIFAQLWLPSDFYNLSARTIAPIFR